MSRKEEFEPNDLNESYADQTGHYYRGVHNDLKKYFGFPPKCMGGNIRISEDLKRKMLRVPKDGK